VSGRAQQVLDYIEWVWHCARVSALCDTPTTAIAAFDSFQRTASAERGRQVSTWEAA
jgi:hypothetical protein